MSQHHILLSMKNKHDSVLVGGKKTSKSKKVASKDKKVASKDKKVASKKSRQVLSKTNSNSKYEPTDLDTRSIFRLLDLYFYRKFHIYKHLYDSYDTFLDEYVTRYLLDGEHVFSETIQADMVYKNKFVFENLRYRPPTFDNQVDPLFPADARRQSRTYSVTLHADVTQYLEKFKTSSRGKPELIKVGESQKDVPIGYFPLMLRSKYCNTNQHPEIDNRECIYDPGGVFEVNGSAKVVLPQDRMVENKPLVFVKKETNVKSYEVQVNSKSYDPHKMQQSLKIRLRKDNIMTIRVPILVEINVFILFRALGIESDRDIINYTTYDESDRYMTNIVRVTLSECKNEKDIPITTREDAYDYLVNKMKIIQKTSDTSTSTKMEQKKLHLTRLLENNFLPHISGSLKAKAMYLGYMINRLMRVSLGRIPIDDRDSYLNKRIDLPGDLMFDLFKQQFRKMLNECRKFFDTRTDDENRPYNIIPQIKPNTIEQGLKAALSTGSWGRKKGVAQVQHCLTYQQKVSFLRRVDAQGGDASSAKLTSPRQLHPSSIGFLCPVQTPEHKNIGLIKHLNLISSVTIMNKNIFDTLNSYLLTQKNIKNICDVGAMEIKYMYKVFFNGDWIGVIDGITENTHKMDDIPAIKLYNDMMKKKRMRIFNPEMVSICIDHNEFELKIYCDSGRCYRPVMRVGKDNKLPMTKKTIGEISLLKSKPDKITNWNKFVAMHNDMVDYIDMEEQPYLMIADNVNTVNKMQKKYFDSLDHKFKLKNETDVTNRYNKNYFVRYTHCEFHPSVLLGEIAINIPFIDSNAGVRNIFQYSQGRQAMTIYATNYRDRTDLAYILYNPQRPIVTTRSSKYVNSHALPFGEIAMVVIAPYAGFNQEDSLGLNRDSVQRGMFRSASLRKYISTISKNQNASHDDKFMRPDPSKVVAMKEGAYDKVNAEGYAERETVVKRGDVVISKVKHIPQSIVGNSEKIYKDDSETYEEFAPGVIDGVYPNILNQDSYKTCKVRIRSERVPKVGDKFCCYTKGHNVLTTKGWIGISQITKKHKVASLVDGELVYQHPTAIQEYDCDEDVYVIQSNHVDLKVTMNHRMYVADIQKKKWRISEAREILGKQRCYKKNVDKWEPVGNSKYIQKNPRKFILHKSGDKPEMKLDMKAFLTVFGVWMAEGWVLRDWSVSFAAHKQKVKDSLKEHFDAMGFKINKNLDIRANERHIWNIADRRLVKLMKSLSVEAVGRKFPKWVWQLTREECKWLIDGMTLGDGHTMENGTRIYDTSSNRLAGEFQRLCLHAGFACNKMLKYEAGHTTVVKKAGHEDEVIKSTVDAWRLTILETKVTPLVNKTVHLGNQSDRTEHFKGKVYCCSVPGDGIIYVRRNGKVVWCGQSVHGQKGTIGILPRGVDMYHTRRGIKPDIILSPNAIPTRMTIGHLMECIVGKVAGLQRRRADATPFEGTDIADVKRQLKELGYREDGTEYIYNGMTGERIDTPTYFGPTFYCRLKHLVEDKIHARARGPKTTLTRQTPEGRARNGGLRVGKPLLPKCVV